MQKQRYTTGQDALTDSEYDKLMAGVDNIEDECLFTIAISIGLRRFDLTNIRISGLHLQNTKYRFEDNQELVGNWLRYNEKKKGNRIRVVPLNDKCVIAIKKLLNSRGKDYKSDFLFSFKDKTAFNHLQKYCDKAGIRRRPIHALRATCIKRCQKANWTPEQVAALVGDTIAVIQEHYSTPSMSEMMEVADTKSII